MNSLLYYLWLSISLFDNLTILSNSKDSRKHLLLIYRVVLKFGPIIIASIFKELVNKRSSGIILHILISITKKIKFMIQMFVCPECTIVIMEMENAFV